MPIQSSAPIDLQTDSVCSFLRVPDTLYDDLKFNDSLVDLTGFNLVLPTHPMPMEDPPPDIYLYTSKDTDIEIVERFEDPITGQQFERHSMYGTVHEIYAHPIRVIPYAALYLRNDGRLGAARAAEVTREFMNFNVGTDDLADLETRLANGGGGSGDYWIIQSFTLEKTGPYETNSNQEDNVRRQLPSEAYRIRKNVGEETCRIPDINFGDNVIVVPDIDSPEDALAKDGEEEHAKQECFDLKPTVKRVGKVLPYIEFKIEWLRYRIRIGRCKLGYIKLPTLCTRESAEVLYSYVLMPSTVVLYYEKAVGNIIEDVLKQLPLLAVMVALGDFTGAENAFKQIVLEHLEELVPIDQLKCFIPKLKIVTERADWKKFPQGTPCV